MANILHSLQSTFTTCACGNSSSTCVLRRMKEFVTSDDSSSTQRPHNVPRTPLVPGPPPPLSYFPPFIHPSPATPYPHPIFPPPLAIPSLPGPATEEDTPRERLVMTPTVSSHLHHPHPHPAQPHSPAPQEDKQIWGSKIRLSARQKHPTLNLNLDLGPLIGTKRGFRVRERLPGSGGLAGCEMWPGEEALEDFRKAKESTPPPTSEDVGNRHGRVLGGLGLDTLDGGYWGKVKGKGKGKERSVEEDMVVDDEMSGNQRARRRTRSRRQRDVDVDMDASIPHHPQKSKSPSPPPPPPLEDQVPPKMRKARIHREARALAETAKKKAEVSVVGDGVAIERQGTPPGVRELPRTQSQTEMPPPPVPVRKPPSTSPPPQSDKAVQMSRTPTPPPPIPSIRPPSPSPATTFAQLSLVSPTSLLARPSTNSDEVPSLLEIPASPMSSPPPSETATRQPSVVESPHAPHAAHLEAKDAEMALDLEYLEPSPNRWHSPLHHWEPMTRVRHSPTSEETREIKQEMLEKSEMMDVEMNGVENENEDIRSTPASPPPLCIGSSPLSSPPPEHNDMDVDPPPRPLKTSPHRLSSPSTVTSLESRDPPDYEGVDPPPQHLKTPRQSPSPSTASAEPPVEDPPPKSSEATLNGQKSPSPRSSPSALPCSPDAPLKKQKLSLKDFALRRKRMREAEEAAKGDSRGEVINVNVQPSVVEGEKQETVHGQMDEVTQPVSREGSVLQAKMDLQWLLQPSLPPVIDVNGHIHSSQEDSNKPPTPTIPHASSSPEEPTKTIATSEMVIVPPSTSPTNVRPRITVKEALASIKASASPHTPSTLTPISSLPTPMTSLPTPMTSLPTPMASLPTTMTSLPTTMTSLSTPMTSLPNPPANLIHKLPPRPNVAPPPSTGSISAGDTITSIAHPSILPGVKAHQHSPTERERPVTPETPPWERSEDDPRGREHPDQTTNDRSSSRQQTPNPRWDAWLKWKWKGEGEKGRKQRDVDRQREIEDEIDRQRIENDNRFLRQKERERERERTRERERERDDGYVDEGQVLRYDDEQYHHPRSRSRDLVDRRRDDHRRSHEREPLSRRRSLFDNAPESISSSKSPSPSARRACSTTTFFSPAPPPDEQKPLVPPAVAAPNLSSNPKWSPTMVFTPTSTIAGTSPWLFNHDPGIAPPVATPKSGSPAPIFSHTPGISPVTAPPAPAIPPPAPRPKSPPTQPRSFANTTREPPKGPRALMAHQGGSARTSVGRIREWDGTWRG